MQSYTQTESLNCTPDEVFDWLKDWDHIRAWMGPSLVSIDMLSDHDPQAPICEGMVFREVRKMGKMNAKAKITVDRHEVSDRVFYHRAFFDDGCNRMLSDYQYQPTQTGCEVTWTMSSEPNKWWTKILNVVTGPMMLKMVAKCEKDHLRTLKSLMESK